MIKKATKEDRKRLLTLANESPCINLFIIGDIETYGFDKDFQEIWYEEIDGEMEGIYLRYRGNGCIYSKNNKMNKLEIADWLRDNKINHLNTCGRNGDFLWDVLEDEFVVRPTYMCELKNTNEIKYYDIVDTATVDDARNIAIELQKIEEFQGFSNYSLDELESRMASNISEGRKTVCVKQNGEIASFAQISIESSTAGMIVSVFTSKKYRGKGYAKACVSTICAMLLKEGKSACLFYNNPSAGRIYHSLGFETVDTYNMYTRKDRL